MYMYKYIEIYIIHFVYIYIYVLDMDIYPSFHLSSYVSFCLSINLNYMILQPVIKEIGTCIYYICLKVLIYHICNTTKVSSKERNIFDN